MCSELKYRVHPTKTGRGISVENRGYDDVFSSYDLNSGPETHFVLMNIFCIIESS